jgi:hypothetical protein
MNCNDFSQATHDQLNNQWDYLTLAPRMQGPASYSIVDSGNVLNYVMHVMHLTCGKLLKQTDWQDWQHSKWLQLDQYFAQGMFGVPTTITSDEAVFNLVWTYIIKALNGQKKAWCTCNGSPCSGMVRVLNKTYANCVEQTSSHLFYAIAAAEKANVSNTFAEVPPPKQGFFIRPDCAFHKWWTLHLHRPPIPEGHVILVLSAMQSHPKYPQLWEKHADNILWELDLVPNMYEPCLYLGFVDGKRTIFMRQVDDFAIAARDQRTADILLDMLDD